MSSLFRPSTQAEMKASFPDIVHAATDIVMRELIRILQYVMACARTHNSDYNIMNMFYVTVPQRIYALIAGGRRPDDPVRQRDTPDYGLEQTSAGQAQIRDVWSRLKMFFDEDENMNRLLTTIFLSLLPAAAIQGFRDTTLASNPKMKFIDVFNHFWVTYGIIREEDVLDNTKRMQADWQPHQNIEVLFQQIEEGVTFAVMAEKFMDEQTMIDSFLVVIKRTGYYTQYYEEWVALAARFKNWTYNKVFWRAKYLLKKMTTTPAHEHGFGGNTQEAEDAAYDAKVENFARGHASTQGQAESMANTIQQQQ